MCFEQYPLSHCKRLQKVIFVFSQKEAGAKSVVMATTWWSHSVSFVAYFAGAKFEGEKKAFQISSNYFLYR